MVTFTKIDDWPGAMPGKYQIHAFADEKADVTAGMTIHDLPPGIVPQPGSKIVTADGEIAFLKSNGKWHWAGEEGDVDV